jgi:hypothetical protein
MKNVGILIISAILIGLMGCNLNPPVVPQVSWQPEQIGRTIGNGSANLPFKVQFECSADLANASLLVDPRLEPYVMLNDARPLAISGGTTYEFSITLRIPKDAAEGTYSGTIALQADGKTIDGVLPVDVTIDYGNIVLSNRVKQLSEATVMGLESMKEDQSEFVFSQNYPELDNVQAGDIIVAGITPKTPYGFYRKVTSLTRSGKVTIQAVEAKLEEVIVGGSINISEPITGSVRPVPLGIAQSRGTGSVGGEKTICFPIEDIVLYDYDGKSSTTNDQIRLNLTTWLTLGFNLTLDFDEQAQVLKDKVKYIKFATYGSIKWDYELEALVECQFIKGDWDLDKLFGFLPFLPELPSIPIPVPVGGIVLTFAISPFIRVGAEASVFAGVKAGATIEAKLEVGCEYKRGSGWTSFQNFTRTFTFNPPRPSLGANILLYSEFGLKTQYIPIPNFPLTDVDIGPTLALRGFVEFEADLFATPCWQLFDGRSIIRGFQCGTNFFTLVDWQEPHPFTVKEVIGQGSCPSITATPTPSPTPSPTVSTTASATATPTATPTPTPTPTASQAPDLAPTDITYSGTLASGSTIAFDSGVQNLGNGASGVFNVAWYVDGARVAYGSHTGVPAGSTVLNGNSAFSWVGKAGSHTITFTVDVDRHVGETNEGNNSRSLSIYVR